MTRLPVLSLFVSLVIGVMPITTLASGNARLPALVLNDTNQPPYTTKRNDGYVNVIATEAFRRAGLALQLVQQPPERGLQSANEGTIDGDLTRIAGLEPQYPNLVRVPEPLMDWEFVAFGNGKNNRVDWTTVRKSRVGHIRGWKIYEQALAGAPSVIATTDAKQLFLLLTTSRIDFALHERWIGTALLRELGFTALSPLDPPLSKREMYIYLNRRHADHVPALAKALADMKTDGFYRRARARHLDAYFRIGQR